MLDIERDAQRARELLDDPKVRAAMLIRCEQEHHAWRNACSAFFEVYQACEWCGARRTL